MIATSESNSAFTRFMPYSDEPEGLPPRRPVPPSHRETEPIMGAQDHQIERLMSLGVPRQTPWVSEPEGLQARYGAH